MNDKNKKKTEEDQTQPRKDDDELAKKAQKLDDR